MQQLSTELTDAVGGRIDVLNSMTTALENVSAKLVPSRISDLIPRNCEGNNEREIRHFTRPAEDLRLTDKRLQQIRRPSKCRRPRPTPRRRSHERPMPRPGSRYGPPGTHVSRRVATQGGWFSQADFRRQRTAPSSNRRERNPNLFPAAAFCVANFPPAAQQSSALKSLGRCLLPRPVLLRPRCGARYLLAGPAHSWTVIPSAVAASPRPRFSLAPDAVFDATSSHSDGDDHASPSPSTDRRSLLESPQYCIADASVDDDNDASLRGSRSPSAFCRGSVGSQCRTDSEARI